MRQFAWAFALFLSVISFACLIEAVAGSDPVSAQDIARLSQADRIIAMRTFLERRIDRVSNIEVKSETRLFNRKWSNGALGDRTFDGGRWQFHTLGLDGSYRVKTGWYATQAETEVDTTSESHYDNKSGTIRSTSQRTKQKGRQGRIGGEHLPNAGRNRVAFYLLGGSFIQHPFADKCQFLLQSLVECSHQWHVDVNLQSQQVVISHPYRIAFVEDGAWGQRKVHFDVAKGMLPVKIDVDYSADLEGITDRVWREERIMMDEPRSFDGFWMPMRIEERLRTSSGKGDCSIFLTHVKEVVFGGVKAADLSLKFPRDTEVADTLKNVFYRTGPDGEPTGPVNPIGIPKGTLTRDSQGQVVLIPEEPKPNWMLRIGIWSVTVGSILFLGLYVLRRFLARGSVAVDS